MGVGVKGRRSQIGRWVGPLSTPWPSSPGPPQTPGQSYSPPAALPTNVSEAMYWKRTLIYDSMKRYYFFSTLFQLTDGARVLNLGLVPEENHWSLKFVYLYKHGCLQENFVITIARSLQNHHAYLTLSKTILSPFAIMETILSLLYCHYFSNWDYIFHGPLKVKPNLHFTFITLLVSADCFYSYLVFS